MRSGILTAVLVVFAASAVSGQQQNMIPNGDFSDGLKGWIKFNAETVPELDEADYHSAPASLRLPPAASRVCMKTTEYSFQEPLPTAVTGVAWVKHSGAKAGSKVGLDLKIIFEGGDETWFLPPSLMLTASEKDRWLEKTGTYVAPPGKKIAAVGAFCINYDSGATAWYDDVEVYGHVTPETVHEVAVLYARTADEPAAKRVSEALAAAGIEHDILPFFADLEPLKLVAAPTWTEDDRCYFRLKVFHYLGGRVVLCDLAEQRWARALARYLWDDSPSKLTEPQTLSTDGRAAHLKLEECDPAQLGALAKKMLATGVALPEEVPALDCGPKEAYSLREGALYVGEEPLLFRAMGTYAVNGTRLLAQHEANFAHYEDLGLNGLVIYLSYETPVEHLRAVLDLAWQHGLRAMVWLYGPPASPYTEKPLKDDWLLKFLALRRHPAWLGWIMCDDTFDRYYPFVQRTSQVLHRYDRSNLITTTSMDFRWADRLTAETWSQWKELLDFPLTYLYPLQKGRTFGGYEDIEGGLEDVQRLSENVKRIWGEPVYIQQWCQAHMQGFSYDKVGLARGSTFIPTCEQQRLLTYMMLTASTRGILYFSSYGLADSALGMGRRAELGLLWGELEPVQDIVAAGGILSCETSEPQVEAAAFTRNGETVVLALKHGEDYNRYVCDAVVEDLRIQLPAQVPEGARCLRLDGVEPVDVPLAPDRKGVTLETLDVTAALLITAAAERISGLAAHREQWAQLAARLALTAAADKLAKTEVVGSRLEGWLGADFEEAIQRGNEAFAEAVQDYEGGQYAEAVKEARLALRGWRAAQATAIRWAEAEHERRGLDEGALLKLNIFPALPKFVELHCDGPEIEPGAMRTEVRERLAQHDFLVREPKVEAEQ